MVKIVYNVLVILFVKGGGSPKFGDKYIMDCEKETDTLIFNDLPIAVIILDDENKIKYVNNAFLSLCKCNNITIYSSEPTLLNELKHIKSLEDNTVPFEKNYIKHIDNSYYRITMKNEILDKNLKYTIITLDNINCMMDDKTLNLITLNDLKEELAHTEKLLNHVVDYDKLKTEFFANISHELRTPINIIFSSLQLFHMYLNRDLDKDTVSKLNVYEDSMKQNCYRLLRLINNLIDITKIDSGYLNLNLSKCNIVNVIENITLSVVQYAESKSLNLLFDTDIEEKISFCDIDKIERIMLNLLSNAIKFTNPGDSIFVNIYDKGDNIQISVKDTGIGIPEDKLPILFKRFQQANKDLQKEREGSGIGLSLVKSMVEMHGGTISVNSTYGEGSEFIVKIPNDSKCTNKTSTYSNTNIQNHKSEKINIEFSDIYFS